MLKRNRFSFIVFVSCCIFLVSSAFFVKKWNWWGSLALISWDVSGYYMYLPGFFYDDLGILSNQQYIIDTYHPCDTYLNEHVGPIGKYVIKYSSGMAILYLPGFILGHIYAKLGNYPVDGFSYPYQICMAMYSLLVSFLGLWMSRKLLLYYFTDHIAAITLLLLVFATNYLNYAGINNMFTHSYLFTIYSVIIYFSIQWHQTYEYKKAIILGALCGLATLTRPTEIISMLIPLGWGIGNFSQLRSRINTLWSHYPKICFLFFSAIAIGSIQLIYWKVYAGHSIYWSYGDDDGLNFLKVHFWNCVFSYKKGWFVYTPFMICSIIGFIPLYKKDKALFWNCFIFTFIALYIVFSWKSWAYGGSFSMRAVVQYYALLVFPVAALFEYALKRKFFAVPLILFSIFCIWLNIVMTYQANGGDNMESDNMSKKYYWKIFGQIHSDYRDKKFIDTDEEIPASLELNLASLTNVEFCQTVDKQNCVEFKNQQVFLMTKGIEFIPETRVDISESKGEWFRITCQVDIEKGEPNYWNQPQLYAWIVDGKMNDIKQKSYRIQRIASYGKWDSLSIDILIPKESDAKYLKTGIYNPKGDVLIYIRNLKVEYVNS